jgi:hypothetical protein
MRCAACRQRASLAAAPVPSLAQAGSAVTARSVASRSEHNTEGEGERRETSPAATRPHLVRPLEVQPQLRRGAEAERSLRRRGGTAVCAAPRDSARLHLCHGDACTPLHCARALVRRRCVGRLSRTSACCPLSQRIPRRSRSGRGADQETMRQSSRRMRACYAALARQGSRSST